MERTSFCQFSGLTDSIVEWNWSFSSHNSSLSRPLQLLSTPSSFNRVIVSGVDGCCVLVMSARDYCCCTVLKKITCFDSQRAAPRQLAWLSASILSLKQISFVCVCMNRKVKHQGWQTQEVCVHQQQMQTQTIVTIETEGGMEKPKVFSPNLTKVSRVPILYG